MVSTETRLCRVQAEMKRKQGSAGHTVTAEAGVRTDCLAAHCTADPCVYP